MANEVSVFRTAELRRLLRQTRAHIVSVDPFLRRSVWQPLRRAMEIVHVVPILGAIITFMLLANVGQLREIYLSTLEDLSASDRIGWGAIRLATAVAGFALLSAAFHEAHYWLSTMRIGVIYSTRSNPEVGSRLLGLRRAAAFVLALAPWLGLAVGLLGAQSYLANRRGLLAEVGESVLQSVHRNLPEPSDWTMFISIIVLGATICAFADRYRRHLVIQIITVAIIPFAAGVMLVFLTDPCLRTANRLPIEALLGTALGGGLFYLVYYRLHTMRGRFLYAHPWRPDTGADWRMRRRIALFLWGCVPWIALALYICFGTEPAATAAAQCTTAPSTGDLADAIHPLRGVNPLAQVPLAAAWAAAAGLWIAMLLDRFRERPGLRWAVAVAVVGVLLAVAIVSLRNIDAVVSAYRTVGPLASLSVGLLLLFATFSVLGLLSQKSGFPALSLIILAIIVVAIFPVSIKTTVIGLTIVCAAFAVMAALSRQIPVMIVAAVLALPGFIQLLQPQTKAPRVKEADASFAVKKQFNAWLKTRLDKAQLSDPAKYPVFIVAVEGGGIYAATAASLLLAKLEECRPGFSQHVFAISGVSGGAIGASVFQALYRSAVASQPRTSEGSREPGSKAEQARPGRCEQPEAVDQARPTLTAMLSGIMQDDHFSPVVGAIFPQLLGAPRGRAEALEASFSGSVRAYDPAAARNLNEPFDKHWSQDSLAPALMLNATWAETGLRVAFAPFLLHATKKDQSLYSFLDEKMPEQRSIPLMQAAVVSARFPAILPPYSLQVTRAGQQPEAKPADASNYASSGLVITEDSTSLWNFVDGGYSDSSGAGTALALYKAIEEEPKMQGLDVRLVLLTSAPPPDVTDEGFKAQGTSFRDTLTPIAAIVNVRERLGTQAVSRACDHFQPGDSNCDNKPETSNNVDGHLKIIEIEDQTFGLPLGWKLSRSTIDVISWMLGDPKRCITEPTPPEQQPDRQDTRKKRQTERNNSCVLDSLARLVQEKRAAWR